MLSSPSSWSTSNNIVLCLYLHTCITDRCFFEPDFCPFVKQIGCDRDNLQSLAIQCCKSCPKVATPPTDLPIPIGTGIGTVTAPV